MDSQLKSNVVIRRHKANAIEIPHNDDLTTVEHSLYCLFNPEKPVILAANTALGNSVRAGVNFLIPGKEDLHEAIAGLRQMASGMGFHVSTSFRNALIDGGFIGPKTYRLSIETQAKKIYRVLCIGSSKLAKDTHQSLMKVLIGDTIKAVAITTDDEEMRGLYTSIAKCLGIPVVNSLSLAITALVNTDGVGAYTNGSWADGTDPDWLADLETEPAKQPKTP